MGNVLEAPVTEKDTTRFERIGVAILEKGKPCSGTQICEEKDAAGARVNPGKEYADGIAAATSSMQGWRRSMEDRVCARMDIKGLPLGAKHIFGIFDGHGGDSVAEFCRSHLIDGIVERLQARHSTLSFPSGKKTRPSVGAEDVGDDGPLDVADCVREMCREVDAQVKGEFFTPAGRYVTPRVYDPLDVTPPPQAQVKVGENGPGIVTSEVRRKSNSLEDSEASIDADGLAFSTCGTTSLIIVITDAWIVCCNTGDSRAVLASEGVSKPLSRDHTPENPHERERIEAAGGAVKHKRVDGRLAVSRCIGDHPFKSDPNLPRERQMVVCDPEVTMTARSDEDEFVVMACDGVWDVMGNDEACNFFRKRIQDGCRDIGEMLERMQDACLAKSSMDNMSILMISFRAAWVEGSHVHKSARFILQWGCKQVVEWLSDNNFGQYQDDFENHAIDGAALLSLTEEDLHHKLRLKKVALRKKLWQKLSPLRQGYLAWSKRELAEWLGYVGLGALRETFVQEGIDGRVLSVLSKAEIKSLAEKATPNKDTRRRVYSEVWKLREGLGNQWIPLLGVERHIRPEFSLPREGSRPHSSSSYLIDELEVDDGGDGGNAVIAKGENGASAEVVDTPVVVGKGRGAMRSSSSSVMNGARRLSRKVIHKFPT
ncbi:unnamed protein product [Ascophyllum nodosum]